MPINRRELITKLDKLIEAEKISQPLDINLAQEIDAEDISAEDSEDILALSQLPGLLDTPSSTS